MPENEADFECVQNEKMYQNIQNCLKKSLTIKYYIFLKVQEYSEMHEKCTKIFQEWLFDK